MGITQPALGSLISCHISRRASDRSVKLLGTLVAPAKGSAHGTEAEDEERPGGRLGHSAGEGGGREVVHELGSCHAVGGVVHLQEGRVQAGGAIGADRRGEVAHRVVDQVIGRVQRESDRVPAIIAERRRQTHVDPGAVAVPGTEQIIAADPSELDDRVCAGVGEPPEAHQAIVAAGSPVGTRDVELDIRLDGTRVQRELLALGVVEGRAEGTRTIVGAVRSTGANGENTISVSAGNAGDEDRRIVAIGGHACGIASLIEVDGLGCGRAQAERERCDDQGKEFTHYLVPLVAVVNAPLTRMVCQSL